MRSIDLSWFGLRSGPAIVDSSNERIFSLFYENPSNDPELFDLATRFQAEYMDQNPSRENFNPQEFGSLFDSFAEQNGYQVKRNCYLILVRESMTQDEQDELIERLRAGEVSFKFRKVNGEIREARGTLSQDLIPTRPNADRVDGARRTHRVPDSVIVYYDLDREAFRSFKKDNFEGYID